MERSLTGLTRPRPRECGEGAPRCRERPADGYNPLGLCDCHLALYRERIRLSGGIATPIGSEPVYVVFDAGEGSRRHLWGAIT